MIFFQSPITRFIARYIMDNPQQDYEKMLHMLTEEQEKAQLRLLEKKIHEKMSERADYQAYYYRPAIGKYHRISKEAKEKNIFMFCAGMGSKCLIAALRKLYPDSLFIDIGSGIDFLCAKRNTRGAALTYEIIENYFKPILPDDWNDPKYDPILKMVPTFLTGCDN